MKKILIFTLFAGLCSVLAAAGFTHPGFSCTDKNKIAEAIANADAPSRLSSVLVLQRVNEKEPENFNELCKLIDEVTASVKFPSVAARESARVGLKKQYPLLRKQCAAFRQDAIALCAKTPTEHDAYYYMKAKDLFTPSQRYLGINKCLMKFEYNPTVTLMLIEELVVSGIELEGVDVKGDLNKLNKKFSLRLVRDKATWTPIVQAIRTAMSAY